MYLSRLMLNLRYRPVQRDLADRYELHRTLMSAFPQQLPDYERMLYRVEENPHKPFATVLVQSQLMPRWETSERIADELYLANVPDMREVNVHATVSMRLPFRLQANPTVKRDGKRHALYHEEQLLNWLVRKAHENGFKVESDAIRFVKHGNKYGKRRKQTWHAVQFDGVLTITDPDRFKQAVYHGIGSAKAFGFGLLSIPYLG